MKWEYDCEDFYASLKLTDEKKDLIVNTVLDMFTQIGFEGETICQSDRVYEEAPWRLGELADKLNFNIEWKW